MLSRFRHRSNELENIDKGTYTADEYEGCLVELRRVNRWLGDTRALEGSLLREIGASREQRFSLLDVAAGSGQLLHVAATWARYNNRRGQFVGLELNARSAQAILEGSNRKILAVQGDALLLPFPDNTFEYGISSLFIHHLTDEQTVIMLRELGRVTSGPIFVIDLHRHPIAYFLYTTVGKLMLHNRLLREDGALSILRAFKPDELHRLAERAGLIDIRVDRSFPFRLVLSARKREEAQVATDVVQKIRLAS